MQTSAENLKLTSSPVMTAGMLIRKPVAEVYQAFVDPQITTRFWFTHGSGPLEAGARVEWRWEMYGVAANVDVQEIEQNRRILIEWGSDDEPATRVEWTFKPLSGATTYVSITNSGFHGNGDEQCAAARDSMGGFSFVLAGAKAFLEHGIELNLVADHFPPGLAEG